MTNTKLRLENGRHGKQAQQVPALDQSPQGISPIPFTDVLTPTNLDALQRLAGNAAVAQLVTAAAAPPRLSGREMSAQLDADVHAIVSELDSIVYTEGVEEAVIGLLRKRVEMPLTAPPQDTYMDNLFGRLQQKIKIGPLAFRETNYYDVMFDRFDRVDELRGIRDSVGRKFRGRESTSQRAKAEKERAEGEEDELNAQQGGGWTENVGIDTPIPRTPENVYMAKRLLDQISQLPTDSQTPMQRAIARRIRAERMHGGPGTDWMFHGVHFITAEERNRWKKELGRLVVITTLMIVATIVTEGLVEMFAPDLIGAIVGAEGESEVAAAAEMEGEATEAAALTEETAGTVPRQKFFRGQARGVPTVKQGQVLHDFGDGLYLTDSEEVAELYAKTRGKEVGSMGEVLSAELDPKTFGRVLDMRADPRWAEFVKKPPFPGSATTNEALIRLANENYGKIFDRFLQENRISLEEFDTIIGPEYVRGGNQICVRNPEIAQHIRAVLRTKP